METRKFTALAVLALLPAAGWVAALHVGGAGTEPPVDYRVSDPRAELRSIGLFDKDLEACVKAATQFLSFAVGAKPTSPPIIRADYQTRDNPELQVTVDELFVVRVNYKDFGVRDFMHTHQWKEPVAREPVLTEAEAVRRMTKIATKIGLPKGAAFLRVFPQSSGRADTPAKYLVHTMFGFKDHGYEVPASFVHLSMNLLNGQLMHVNVDRRKYTVESNECQLTEAQAKKAATQYAKEHRLGRLVKPGVAPNPGSPGSVRLMLFDVAAGRSWPKKESVPARLRLMWFCRFSFCSVGIDAATGETLTWDSVK